jgi:FHS family glucose/mannose:H+ symporter-like MFS transporter
VSYNTVVGLQYEGAKSSGALNRMNAFFGIGALIGPLIVSLGYSLLSNPDVALWFSAACALPLSIAAILLGGEVTKLRTAHADASATQTNQTSTMRQVFASPVFWVMCAVMGLYVGCEVAFSGWATEYTRRLALTTTAQAAIAVSAFWMGLAFSRYFTEALIKRMSPANFMVLTIFVAMMGLVTMFMTGQWSAPAYGGAFIAGLGFGPIYPTLISIGIQRFRSAAQLVTSVLTSAGSLGSLFLPTLTGYVLTRSSPIHAWLLLLGALTVTTGLWLLVRKNAEPAAKAVKPILETSNPQAQAVPANSQYY